jgi:hypothetical protein
MCGKLVCGGGVPVEAPCWAVGDVCAKALGARGARARAVRSSTLSFRPEIGRKAAVPKLGKAVPEFGRVRSVVVSVEVEFQSC